MFGKIFGAIVAIGVVWGVASWAGDGHTIGTTEWVHSVQEKVKSGQETTVEKLEQNLPDPDSLNIELPLPSGEKSVPKANEVELPPMSVNPR